MKNAIINIAAAITFFSAGYFIAANMPKPADLVKLEHTKSGLFILDSGRIYTVSELVTTSDTYQKVERAHP
jgi:hypothetical protein